MAEVAGVWAAGDGDERLAAGKASTLCLLVDDDVAPRHGPHAQSARLYSRLLSTWPGSST